MKRRSLLKAAIGGLLLPVSMKAEAAIHGSSSLPAPTRVIVAVYGQSNADTFGKSAQTGIFPNSQTYYYNGTSVVNPIPVNTIGDGLITAMNQINNVTGLPVLGLIEAVGGSPISGFTSGNSAFNALVSQINANLLPTDALFILWDQGEGDTDNNPFEVPYYYKSTMAQIHSDLVGAIGRTKATCPWMVACLGFFAGTPIAGTPNGGNNTLAWHVIQQSQFDASTWYPDIYPISNCDIVHTDGYHYAGGSTGTIRMGQRFARNVTTIMGYTTGWGHFEIASAAVVDATHTDVTVNFTGGATGFAAVTNGQGWGVSGDNGATFDNTAVANIQSANVLRLTHASLSQSKSRVVQYQWGFNPPGYSGNNPPPGVIYDNSALAIPLTPTTFDVRCNTGGTTVPCPQWCDFSTPSSSGTTQTTTPMSLGPGNYQKTLILVMDQGFWQTQGTMTVTVKPNVGSTVSATHVADLNTSGGNGLYIWQANLLADANSATECTITLTFPSNPFSNTTINLYAVPTADLNSLTSTASASNSQTATTAGTCTCTVSAGGFVVAIQSISASQSSFWTLTSGYAQRWTDSNGFWADASNLAGPSATMATTYVTSGNIDTLMASWR